MEMKWLRAMSSDCLRNVVAAGACAVLNVCVPGTAVSGERGKEEGVTTIEVHAGIQHDALFDMYMNRTKGLAVGGHGLILLSSNGGETWHRLDPPPTDNALLGVAVNKRRGVIVGQEGTILITNDWTKWTEVDSGVDVRLLNVAMTKDGVAIAVGGFGTILRSTDHGENWEQVEIDWETFTEDGYEPHLYDLAFMGDGRVVIVGEFELVLNSSDQGLTWERRNLGDASIFALHMVDQRVGFAVGQRGLLLRSNDGGASWTPLYIPTETNLLGVWASSHDEIVVVGIRALLRSSDGGITWIKSDAPEVTRTWYQALAAAESTVSMPGGTVSKVNVYVAGHRGTISRVVE